MRIKRISVKNLFGIFDHSIALNMDERITIIHGPNGIGKTIILRMLDGFFNSRYAVWQTTPFEEFRIDFEDDSYVKIQPYLKSAEPTISVYFSGLNAVEQINPVGILLGKIPDESVLDDYATEFSAERENLEGETDRLVMHERIRRRRESEPEWLYELRKSVDIRFIGIDRRLKKKAEEQQQPVPMGWDRQGSFELTGERYAKELTEVIQAALAEYGEVSQALDRTFPARMIKETPAPGFSSRELQNRLRLLEEKRAHLMVVGLLDSDNASDNTVDGQLHQEIDDRTRSVLSVYVSDTEQKLGYWIK